MSKQIKNKIELNHDILKLTWVNYKNCEGNFEQNFKHKRLNQQLLDDFCAMKKETMNLETVVMETESLLEILSDDFTKVNDILTRLEAPQSLLSSPRLSDKCQWLLGHFQAEIERLKANKTEMEQTINNLTQSHQEISAEYKKFIKDTQSANHDKGDYELKQKLFQMEDEYVYMKSQLENKTIELDNMRDKIVNQHQVKHSIQEINSSEVKEMGSSENENPTIIIMPPAECDDHSIYQEKIDKLTRRLETITNRYAHKRNIHRLQLVEARNLYFNRSQYLDSTIQSLTEKINELTAQNHNLQTHNQSLVNDKNQLSAKILHLENEVSHLQNMVDSDQKQIEINQKHIKQLTQDLQRV